MLFLVLLGYWGFSIVGCLCINSFLDPAKILPKDSPLQSATRKLDDVGEYEKSQKAINTKENFQCGQPTCRWLFWSKHRLTYQIQSSWIFSGGWSTSSLGYPKAKVGGLCPSCAHNYNVVLPICSAHQDSIFRWFGSRILSCFCGTMKMGSMRAKFRQMDGIERDRWTRASCANSPRSGATNIGRHFCV